MALSLRLIDYLASNVGLVLVVCTAYAVFEAIESYGVQARMRSRSIFVTHPIPAFILLGYLNFLAGVVALKLGVIGAFLTGTAVGVGVALIWYRTNLIAWLRKK